MELNDYTQIFDVEKKFRGVNNIRTPEVSYRAVGWGGAALLVSSMVYWFLFKPILGLLPLPVFFQVILAFILILVPALTFGKAATSRMAHDKELVALVRSWVRYRTSPRHYADFAQWREHRGEVIVEAGIASKERAAA